MTAAAPRPPLTPAAHVHDVLARDGHVVVDAATLAALTGVPLADLLAWRPHWDDLPADDYLRDGGRYRQRRHSCFVVDGARVTQAAHRPQVMAPYITTLSPGTKPVTPLPVAAISPEASAPTTSGSCRLANAMPRKPHRSR